MSQEPRTPTKVAATDTGPAQTLRGKTLPQPPSLSVLSGTTVAKSSPIPVVCALIEREGRVLIARRPAHKHLGLKWEFPGGKVEPGEDSEAAIIREIHEELGCAIVIAYPLPPFVYDYGTVVIEMIPFVVHLAPTSAEPGVTEHSELAWVTVDELPSYDLAPADLPVIASYRAAKP